MSAVKAAKVEHVLPQIGKVNIAVVVPGNESLQLRSREHRKPVAVD